MRLAELIARLQELQAQGARHVVACDGDEYVTLGTGAVYLDGDTPDCVVVDLTAGDLPEDSDV